MGKPYYRAGIDLLAFLFLSGKMCQEFDVAFRPSDRRKGQTKYSKIKLGSQLQKIVQHTLVNGRITDNTLLPYRCLTSLKLRLDQTNNLTGILFQKIMDCWKHKRKRDKADIQNGQITLDALEKLSNTADKAKTAINNIKAGTVQLSVAYLF